MKIHEIVGITNPETPLAVQARQLVANDNKLLDDLIKLRRKKGLTQASIARTMGVSQSAVARIESGERDPQLGTLRRYAMAIGALVEHEVSDHFAPRPITFVSYTTDSVMVDPSDETVDPRRTLQLASQAWSRVESHHNHG